MNSKTLEEYLNIHYPFLVYPAEEGGYVAEIEELPGCMTQAETLDELSERIENARRTWIHTAYEDGMQIPLPRTQQQYSGRFLIRLPKYLHRHLAEEATRQGVSLNQFAATLLSGAVSAYHVSTKEDMHSLRLHGHHHLTHVVQSIAERNNFRFTSSNMPESLYFHSHRIIPKELQDSPQEKVVV